MSAPSRVLLVIANGGGGGMQVQTHLLATGLAAAGVDVTVAVGPGGFDADGVDVVRLPALDARSATRFARAVRDVVRRVQPEVVHGHGLRLCPFVAVGSRTPAIVTCHGIDPRRARRTAALVRLSRVKVASCGEGPRRVLAAVGVASRVLDNAVPEMPAALPRATVAARFGLDPATVLAITPARLTDQKDPLTLVRALARAEGVSGVLLGGGPLEAQVRDEVSRLGVDTRVRIAPWQDDARAVLGGADVLALASVWEGQPTVVLEAMQARVVVCATSCTGTVDTVVDEVTGLLAPVGDAEALGDALTRLAEDPELRGSLATAASTRLVGHRPADVVAAHLAAYERLLDGRWL